MRTMLKAACAAILSFTFFASASAEEISGATATVHCPHCGQVMPASFHFCSNCGTSLDNVPRDPAPSAAGTTTSVTRNENGTVISSSTTTVTTTKKGFQLGDLFKNSEGGQGSALSDQPAPLQIKDFPERPKPIVEIGLSPFLGSGPIAPGYVLPTGAVWQPDFIVFGTARSALQTFDDGTHQITEWANRLDLYGNLYFTPTERILIGFRPLDREGLAYSGYRFEPQDGPQNDLNAYVTTLFFQGDFGELFPQLDPNDTKSIDYQFSIGRQPLSFEDGIMINEDVIDAIGVTRTSLFALGASALRVTGIFGWNELNRNDNLRDSSAKLFGLFSSADYAKATIDFDMAYVSASDYTGGDGAYIGIGDTQRLGVLNSTTRVNASFALDRETPAVSTGVLLFQQFSLKLPESEDFVYLDSFWGIADYASAARGYDRGGPLGQTGVLFAAQGLGSYGAPLGNRADDAIGAAFGYQRFLGSKDRQIVFEVGGRVTTREPRFFADSQPNEIATAVKYQMKLNQHTVLVLDAFVGAPEDRDTAYGFRSELLLKF